jgi:hypothetical protein
VIGEEDARALRGEPFDDGAANPAGTSRDNNHAAFKFAAHNFESLFRSSRGDEAQIKN